MLPSLIRLRDTTSISHGTEYDANFDGVAESSKNSDQLPDNSALPTIGDTLEIFWEI